MDAHAVRARIHVNGKDGRYCIDSAIDQIRFVEDGLLRSEENRGASEILGTVASQLEEFQGQYDKLENITEKQYMKDLAKGREK
jgi:hypothetical protein